MIDFLISHGADKVLNAPNTRGYTPLILAASVVRTTFVRFFDRLGKR